jgi:putative tricarboxylic transport membrane protein
MGRLNRDTYVAIVLLLVCGVLFWASFDIRQPDYGTLPPSTWPRIILAVLSLLSLIYLFQSLRAHPEAGEEPAESEREPGIKGWFAYWRNPILCFVMFLVYLVTLPVLGMLIGSMTFVFVLMGLLGGWDRRRLLIHAIVTVCTVGVMWSLFTFGLGVMLPPGMIFNPFG